MLDIEPIATAIVAETHPSYYLMHKYWSRKPHNLVRSYIEHFSRPGEIVLDPFAGSGVTLVEALLAGRKAIAVDINPIASLISEATVLPFDDDRLIEAFCDIERRVKPQIEAIFHTSCPDCSSGSTLSYVVWETMIACESCGKLLHVGEAERRARAYVCPFCQGLVPKPKQRARTERMVELVYTCIECSGKTKVKSPDEQDIALSKRISDEPTRHALKDDRMFVNKRTLVGEEMSVRDLFTARNIKALSFIIDEIAKVECQEIKKILEFTFTACVAQASRLIPYRNGLSTGGPAWTVAGFWIPSQHLEMNAWNCFTNRFQKTLRGKNKLQSLMRQNPYRGARSFDDLSHDQNAWIVNHTATTLRDIIPDSSIDYIFTDPPYGDSVPYLEYCTIWSSWFGFPIDYDQEIIISDSEQRHKDLENYQLLLTSVFQECYRVLKPGRWMSLTFNNRMPDIWDALLGAIAAANFAFVNALHQAPAVVPAKSQLAKEGSAIGDFVLNFRKPKEG